jgi:periplasmic protein CpxP/Spy
MNMIGSRYLASAAIAALLTLPVAAFAQSAAPTTAPSTATTAPEPEPTAPAQSAAQRVETHITQLRAQLRITPAEQPQWNQFAQVMRENARAMDQAFMRRAQQYPTMNAVQNMQSYEQISATHAADMQRLVPAFEALYNAMPAPQKRVADQVFRANAEAHTQKRIQTGRNG